MSKTGRPRSFALLFRLGSLAVLLAVAGALGGCGKPSWFVEEKDPIYKAEITNLWPKYPSILFKKRNHFAWNNVTFTLNKEYIFSVTEIPEGDIEFEIDFEGFRHKDTGEPFDPEEDEVWRIWIEGEKGYWY